MMTQTNVSMAWIIVVAVIAVFALVLVLFTAAMPKFKIMQKLIDRVNLVARETLTGLPVVRAFGREKHEEARFDEASRNLMKTQLFTNRVMTFMMPSFSNPFSSPFSEGTHMPGATTPAHATPSRASSRVSSRSHRVLPIWVSPVSMKSMLQVLAFVLGVGLIVPLRG